MTIFVIGIIACAFLGGIVTGAYAHKYLAAKAASVGITPPPKL